MPHIHEKIDFTVEVFIVHKNRVLLRIHDKYKKWLSVGGHVELNEDPVQAAHREVKEEVGLDIELFGNPKLFTSADHTEELIPPVALNRHKTNKEGHEHITFVYFARAKTTNIQVLQESDKSEECRFFTREELCTLDLWPNVREYALIALDRLGER
jgi:ADP-ribose pyrophosphatase YjhB (NUDIX family)